MRRLTRLSMAAVLLAALATPAGAKGAPVFISDDEWAAVMESHGVDPAMFSNPLATPSTVGTTAGAALGAAKTLTEAGATVVKMVFAVDRLQGARENVEAAGFTFASLLTKDDMGI